MFMAVVLQSSRKCEVNVDGDMVFKHCKLPYTVGSIIVCYILIKWIVLLSARSNILTSQEVL